MCKYCGNKNHEIKKYAGWTPDLALEEYSEYYVLKVVNWIEGNGKKPQTGLYVSSTGFTSSLDEATKIEKVTNQINEKLALKVDKELNKSLVSNSLIDKLEQDYTRVEVDLKFQTINLGISGTITTSQTLTQLNTLIDGIYEAQTSGLYANGLTAKVGYYTKFKKVGTVWTLATEVIIPTNTGTDILNPIGTGIPKEIAVANYVKDKVVDLVFGKNLFDDSKKVIGKLISDVGSISSAVGWAYSGLIDISNIPDETFINLSSNRNRVGAAFFPANISMENPTGGRYYSSPLVGSFRKEVGDKYFAFNLYAPSQTAYTWAQLEQGSSATTYEPFTKFISPNSVKGLTKSMSDTTEALEKATESYINLQNFNFEKIKSDNRLDPNKKVEDALINLNTGEFIFGNASYNSFDKIDVEPNTEYKSIKSNNSTFLIRNILFLNDAGNIVGSITTSTNLFTTPPTCTKMMGAILKTQATDFTSIGIVKSNQTFDIFKISTSIKINNSESTFEKQDDEIALIKDVKIYSNYIEDNRIIKYYFESNGTLTLDFGDSNQIIGEARHDRGFDGNNMFNFKTSNIKTIGVGSSDDVAPQHIMSTTIGANHGISYYIATISNHGYNNSIIGTEWIKNGIKFYPIRIIDNNKIAFISEYSGTSSSFTFTPLTSGVLTYNGINYNITINDSDRKQLYPSIGLKRIKVYSENIEINLDSLGVTKDLKVIEEYDIYNPTSVLNNIKARAGQDIPPNMKGDSACIVKNSYNFKKDFSCVISTEIYYNQIVSFADIMVNQAVKIQGNPFYYIPNSNPIAGLDFRKPLQVTFNSSTPAIYVRKSNLDPIKPPIRIIQYAGNVGFMIGYLPEYNDLSKTSVLFEIRNNTGKIYPHPIDSNGIGNLTTIGSHFDIKLYRTYTDLSKTRIDNRLSYFIVHEENETFIFIDYLGSMIDNLEINIPEINGKKLEVIESKNTTLMSKMFNQGFIVNANYIEGETCYLNVKISHN